MWKQILIFYHIFNKILTYKKCVLGPTITALEVWLIVCVFFIFITMVEYGVVLVVVEMGNDVMETQNNVIELKNEVNELTENYNGNAWIESSMETNGLAKKIDLICLVMLPLSFIVFNVIFWMLFW